MSRSPRALPTAAARRAGRGVAAGALAALLALAGTTSCRRAPEDALPPGIVLAGDAAAVGRVLTRLELLRGTPAELFARSLGAAVARCSRFAAVCPAGGGCDLAGAVTCTPDPDLLQRLDAVRGDADWLFARSDQGGRVTVRGWTAPDGAVRARVRLGGELAGAAAVLLPSANAPAPPVLADASALAHLRLRSDRALELAKLAGEGAGGEGSGDAEDWGDKLYRLRDAAVLGASLEGTWEVVAMAPALRQRVVPLALALHVRDRDRAVDAFEGFLRKLMQTWPLRRSDWRPGGLPGACLGNLNVLPELAPCYVATDRALVFGWNATAVAAALSSPPAAGATGESELRLFLDRFPPADATLQAAYGARPSDRRYPWASLRLHGRREGRAYELALELATATEGAR